MTRYASNKYSFVNKRGPTGWLVAGDSLKSARGFCSGAGTSERGPVYDPDDLSGRRGPLPAEGRKHRHHFQEKVTIQPEQQHCAREWQQTHTQSLPLQKRGLEPEENMKSHFLTLMCVVLRSFNLKLIHFLRLLDSEIVFGNAIQLQFNNVYFYVSF